MSWQEEGPPTAVPDWCRAIKPGLVEAGRTHNSRSQYVEEAVLIASSETLVLDGWMLAKYLTSLSRSICRAMMVCSTASWWQLAEAKKYSGSDMCST